MTKTHRRLKYIFLTPLFIISTIALQFANVQLASAATLTWDGSAGDGLFSTDANWSTGTAPVNGDVISFDVTSLASNTTISNDLADLSLAGINVTGTNSSGYRYQLNGANTLLTGDIANSSGSLFVINMPLQASNDFDITGAVTVSGSNGLLNLESHTVTHTVANNCVYINKLAGTGNLILSGSSSAFSLGSGSVNFHGSISISNGTLIAYYPSALNDSTVNASGTGNVSLYSDDNTPEYLTWEADFNLGGSGWIAAQHSSSSGCAGGTPSDTYTATLTGAVTLASDFLYNGDDNMVVSGPYTNNGHSFTVKAGALGTLTTPEGQVEAPTITTELTGDEPGTNVNVVNKETAILTGVRGDISVQQGGLLKGTGTASNVFNAGVVNPGNSPGTLTILETYSGDGVYQPEILNKDSYDQLQVGANYVGGGNAVTLYSGASLNLVLYDGWAINQGEQFRIIDNQSATAVSGTFNNLPEGTQLTVEGIVFSISYVGGDGNDIVLTALNTGTDPTPPNTGAAKLILGNPIVLATLGIATASLLIFIAIRRRSTR